MTCYCKLPLPYCQRTNIFSLWLIHFIANQFVSCMRFIYKNFLCRANILSKNFLRRCVFSLCWHHNDHMVVTTIWSTETSFYLTDVTKYIQSYRIDKRSNLLEFILKVLSFVLFCFVFLIFGFVKPNFIWLCCLYCVCKWSLIPVNIFWPFYAFVPR